MLRLEQRNRPWPQRLGVSHRSTRVPDFGGDLDLGVLAGKDRNPQMNPSRRRWRTAGVGHEDAFPRPRLSARYRFSQETFAGTRGNGRDAPTPAVRATTIKSPELTLKSHS